MNVLAHAALAAWLDRLAGEKTLIAPCDVQGVVLYRPVRTSAEIAWGFTRPIMSIKEAFFPPTERLLTIQKTGQNIELLEALPEGDQVIFGVRPCDARGLRVLDALFVEKQPADACYARRRQNTALVGVACKELGDSCFCTSLGGAPDDPGELDVMLTEVEGGYAVQAVTPRGEALLEGLAFETLPGEPSRLAATAGIPFPDQAAWPPLFKDGYWEAVSERCLSCRICAYVCPTCRCFDVRDEVLASGNGREMVERLRCWDSCAGEVYRRIAGGHNPRAAKGERMRNRFFCKFYYYPQQYGPTACTGCGRCIDACPVNIDITEVLQHVAEANP